MDDMRARKLALLAEWERDIAPQKLQLESLLPSVWKSSYPASAGGGIGKKRVPASGLEPEPKRPRTEEQERRMEPMYKECQKIMKKMFNLQASNWFRRPVDPVKDGCPNYLSFVKQPRDLGTIKTKLQARAYKSPLELKADVDLVWSNCALYNQEGTPARMDGDKCKAVFDRAWRDSGIEEQLQQIQDEVDCVAAPLHERVGALNNQLVRALEQLPASSSLPEGSARGDMSFTDKRRLSTRLAALSPDLYQGVFDLVSADPSTSVAADGEVEVEVDDLRSDTLWKLHDFVLNPSRPSMQSKPSSKPAPEDQDAAGGAAEKQLPGRGQNGTSSAHPSGAGSDSGGHSPNEVKGSTVDDAQHGVSGFAREGKDVHNAVDESATDPKDQSQFFKDRAAHKADVNINAANLESLASAPPAEVGASDAQPDDVWCSFQSIAEQKQEREEQQQQEAEQAEKQRRQEQERLEEEEEERQRKLREGEERQGKEMESQREEQLEQELDETKTANFPQQSEAADMPAPAAEGGLAAVGMELASDAEDMSFEDGA